LPPGLEGDNRFERCILLALAAEKTEDAGLRTLVKRAILLILLAVLLAVVLPAPAQAQTTFDIKIFPSKLELTGDPGNTQQFVINVQNLGQRDQTLSVYFNDYFIKRNNQFVFQKPGHYSYSCATWLATDTPEVVAPAGQTVQKAFTLSVPAQAEPGGHYGVIFFEQVQPTQGARVTTVPRIGVVTLVTVPGVIVRAGKITAVDVTSRWFWPTRKFPIMPKRKVHARVTFYNEGNVHLTVKGKLTYAPSFGWNTGSVDLGEITVLPKTTRYLEADLKDPPFIGTYEVTAMVTYGPSLDVFDTTVTGKGTFHVYSLSLPALLLVLLTIIFVPLWYRRRRYRPVIPGTEKGAGLTETGAGTAEEMAVTTRGAPAQIEVAARAKSEEDRVGYSSQGGRRVRLNLLPDRGLLGGTADNRESLEPAPSVTVVAPESVPEPGRAPRRGAMGMRDDLLKLAVEIGPRGAGTQAEEMASRYIRERFEDRGLEVTTQEFSSISTYSYLYMIYLSIALIFGVLSYWTLLVYIAAPVALLNAALFALDLETFPVLSRVLPHRRSRNIVGELPAESGEVRMVVVAHYDSARSGLSFSPRLVRNFRLSFLMMVGGVLGVGALTTVNLIVRAASGHTNLGVWIATLVLSAYLLVPLAIMIHRELAMDYTPGANDNASGVVAMLAMVDKASEEESLLPGLMFVATGAEEVGTAGMIEFLKAYGHRLSDALIVNLDNLGTGHLCYIDSEGMLLGHNSSPVLLWLAGKVAAKQRLPIWRTGYRLLSTDATPALARGYQAMSVMAFDDDGRLPNWHWQSDTVDNLDMENLEIARAFLWNLARRADLS
jgi:Peptidase family M28